MHFGATDLAQVATRRQQKKALTSTLRYLVVKNRDLNLEVRQVGLGVSVCITCIAQCTYLWFMFVS